MRKDRLTQADKFLEQDAPTFADGGEMGSLMRALDWSKTLIGPVANWPQSLKTAVRIILTSRYAMFVWWGRDLINLYNDPYRVFLGIKHPDALGKSARDVWEEIWDQIGPRTDAVLLRGESTFDEALLLLMERHGYIEETYFTFSYSPLPDDQGKVGGLFCAVTEETQRVIGERRLTLLSEIATEMAGSFTPDQVCEAASRSLARARRDLPFSLIYLFQSDGRTLRKAGSAGIRLDHPAAPEQIALDDAADLVWQLRAAIDRGEPVVIEDLDERIADLPCGEWSRPPKDAVVVPIARQGQTGPAGVLIAGLNPHRRFENEFKGFVLLLTNQIAAGIANAVAYETERARAEALAELDRTKTLFFSNVSHEFRTPLTLMLGPIEGLLNRKDERLPADDREQLAVAHRNALRLLKLVNTLLDFSRIEAGRVQAVYQPTELCRLTTEVASVFRSAMERAGLRYSIECDPMPEPIYVDREMWEKVVLNLLSNAFKFTFEGEIAVSLRDRGDHVELEVRDTGVGIPEEEQPRVFERFHRIENTRARTYEGTGIGLAFVQELVKLHGGAVRLESSVGEGSVFTISIPKGKAHLLPDRIQSRSVATSTLLPRESYVDEAQGWLPSQSAAALESEIVSDLSALRIVSDASTAPNRERIVLADDNRDMREYLSRLLSRNYEVHAVSDGAEALDAVRRLRPSVVVTDIMMPQLDGFGLLHAIRSDLELNTTPVILLSARAGEEARVEGFQAGADDYLVKPFTARELLTRVETHVKMAALRREAAERESRLRAVAELERRRLERSEERLRLSQSAAEMGTWEWDPIHDKQDLSPELYRIFGTDPADPQHARVWASRVDPADRSRLQEQMQAAYDGGSMDLEYRYRHPERGLRWFYCKGARKPGEPSMFGVVLDVTDRKQAELRSSAQHRVSRVLAESADLAEAAPQILQTVCDVLDWTVGVLWIVDQRSAVLRCFEVLNSGTRGAGFANACVNYSFVKGVGLPGRVWQDSQPHWIHDVTEDRNFLRAHIAQEDRLHAGLGFPVLSRGQVLGVLEFFTEEFRRPDADLLEMMAAIGAQVGQYIDKTHAEQEQHKLAAIVESSDDAIVSKNLNGIVTSWNKAAERMFGFTQEEMLGTSITRIIPPELQDDERRILETIGRGEGIDHFETERLTKSGERIEVSLTISPVRDHAGKIIGAAKIARDITQRKRAEHALRTSERLASVGRLAATVAHEINNPLEAVTNLVYLAKGASEGATLKYLSLAEEELERIAHLTKQTLGFYRETKGAVRTRIGSFMGPLLTVFSARARNNGIEIQTEIRQDPEIMAVPGEIRQLLANFLSNSLDALNRGGQVRIRLSSAVDLHDERRPGVRLTIADSGPGIPSSIRPRLFEPFFTTKKDVGTGLGLWICKSIVEKHQGRIRVKSSVNPANSWTVFSVFLPLEQETSVPVEAIKRAV